MPSKDTIKGWFDEWDADKKAAAKKPEKKVPKEVDKK